MERRRTILFAVSMAMAFSIALFGCGGSATPAASSEDSPAASEEPQVEEEPIETEDELKKQEFEDVKLIDNEYVEIDLVSLYQKETNWLRSDGSTEPMIDNDIAIKIKNKTEGQLYPRLEGYLDGEKLMCISNSFTVEAGKTANESFGVFKDTQPDFTELDSFDDLIKVDLAFTIAGDNAEGVYQDYGTIEINIGDAIAGNTPTETNEEKQADSAQTETEKAPTINALSSGDTISNDNWDVSLLRVDLTDEVLPNDTTGYYYASYEAGSGTVILDFVFDVTCRASKAKSLDDVFGGARATYAGKYEYENVDWYYDDDGGYLRNAARVAFDPLQTWQFHYMILNIPEEALSSDESLSALIQIDGQLWEYSYR